MNVYLLLLLIILVGFYLLDFIVEYINMRSIHMGIPPEFQNFYDQDNYQKSQKYLRETTIFHLWQSSISLLFTIAFLLLGGFAWADQIVRTLSLSTLWTGVYYIGFLSFFSFLVGLPFSIYKTFVIEEKFGFNKTTPKTYCLDMLKGLIVSIVLGVPILLTVLWLFLYFEQNAWLYAWGITFFFIIFVQTIYPQFVMPIFNTFNPLPEGELKEKIENFARKANFAVQGIFVMDGSRRSTKANAFFTGFGRFRRIVLFDTLVKNHSADELVGVLAHEIGHAKLHHIKKSLLLSFFYLGFFYYFLSLLMNSPGLFAAFQVENISVYASLVFIGFLYKPISFVFDVISKIFSRKYEYEADHYAATHCNNPEPLILALKKLSVGNLSNLFPHTWKIFLDYTHPPVLMRIKELKKQRKKMSR